MKTINLGEILGKHVKANLDLGVSRALPLKSVVLNAMKEACMTAIDLTFRSHEEFNGLDFELIDKIKKRIV